MDIKMKVPLYFSPLVASSHLEIKALIQTMPQLSDHTGPGYLCITSQPKPGCVDEYNSWCDSEHGPLRLKLDSVLNGYRYRSTEDPSIQLSTYDLKKAFSLTDLSYQSLTSDPSPREHDLLPHPAPVMMSVAFVVPDAHVPELHRWYEEEHTHDLQQIPGWQRSRRFQLVDSTDLRPGHTELLAVHEFAAVNGLDGPEHEAAKGKPWRNHVLTLVASRKNQRYELVHEFRAGDYRKPVEGTCNPNTGEIPSSMPNGISKVSQPLRWAWWCSISDCVTPDFRIWDTTVS
jgi:hypothetical protein